MYRTFARVIGVALCLMCWAHNATAAPERRLNEELKTLAEKLKEALKSDPKFTGKTIKIGLFPGPQLPNTNFGNQIRLQISAELKALLHDEAALTITGRYDYDESESDTAADDPRYKLQVIRITASIEAKGGKVLANFSVEVNSTDDISEVLGETTAPPIHGGQRERNEQVKKDHEKPDFKVLERTRIAPKEFDAKKPFSVEILVQDKLDGPASPVVPENQKGRAFVDIKPTQFYQIRLHNDGDFAAAAEINIDGLNAISTFNKGPDKPHYYIVPAKGSTTIRGWLHTTTPGAKDSLLAFLVTEYGHGAASRLKSTGEVGVITVRFAAAWEEGSTAPPGEEGARTVGRETKAGPAIPENLKIVKYNVGLPRSTVSVRYSPLEK